MQYQVKLDFAIDNVPLIKQGVGNGGMAITIKFSQTWPFSVQC